MPIEPDDAELLEEVIRSFLLDVHTCLPGRVIEYDAATQTALVQPVIMGHIRDSAGNNIFETPPAIQNVPVRWERAGGYYDHKPLADDRTSPDPSGVPNGDHGWLIFNEGAIARWRATMYTAPESRASGIERKTGVFPPGDVTRHSISYPFFLPGAWPDDKPLPDAPASGEAVSIVPAGGHLRVSKAGSSTADFVALASKVDSLLSTLNSAIASAAATESGASGLGGMSALHTALAHWLSSTAATSLKAD